MLPNLYQILVHESLTLSLLAGTFVSVMTYDYWGIFFNFFTIFSEK